VIFELEERMNWFIWIMRYYGAPVRITATDRSSEEQAELFSSGRTKPGPIITNSPPGRSYHEFGRAFDFTFYGPGYNAPDSWWTFAGEVGKYLGLTWGGDFPHLKDRPHFQI